MGGAACPVDSSSTGDREQPSLLARSDTFSLRGTRNPCRSRATRWPARGGFGHLSRRPPRSGRSAGARRAADKPRRARRKRPELARDTGPSVCRSPSTVARRRCVCDRPAKHRGSTPYSDDGRRPVSRYASPLGAGSARHHPRRRVSTQSLVPQCANALAPH